MRKFRWILPLLLVVLLVLSVPAAQAQKHTTKGMNKYGDEWVWVYAELDDTTGEFTEWGFEINGTGIPLTCTKIAEGDEHEVTRSYFNFFRQSFSDATMLYLFYLPLFVIDLAYLALTGLGVISGHAAVTLILMLLSLGFLGSAIYGAMLVSRYVHGSFQTFRNSWLLAIGYLPKTAAALAAFVLTFALIAVTWPYLGALAVLFGLSAPGYFAVKMILPAFKEQEEKQR